MGTVLCEIDGDRCNSLHAFEDQLETKYGVQTVASPFLSGSGLCSVMHLKRNWVGVAAKSISPLSHLIFAWERGAYLLFGSPTSLLRFRRPRLALFHCEPMKTFFDSL